MSANYDPNQIATSLLYYARARFRDVAGLEGTTVTVPLLQDEEYLGFVERMGDREGLAQAAEALAATFAQKVQSYGQAGGSQVVWPRRADFYLELAKNIRTYGVSLLSGTGLKAGNTALPTPLTDERLTFL